MLPSCFELAGTLVVPIKSCALMKKSNDNAQRMRAIRKVNDITDWIATQ